jgi:hypothetical protein
VASPLQPGVVGLFPGIGCMVPQLFATRANRSYPEFWAIIDGPWYPGYTTLTHPIALRRLAWPSTAFPEGVKPPGQAICLGVDRSGPWWTESLMEKSIFTRTNLSGAKVIMVIMHVPVGELLSQVVTG